MKHAQAVEKFANQFNQPGLFLIRCLNEAQLLALKPDTFDIVYEDNRSEAVGHLLREIRKTNVENKTLHLQYTVHHEEWNGKLENEADVVLEMQRIDNQLYLTATKWRGSAPTLKTIPIDELI